MSTGTAGTGRIRRAARRGLAALALVCASVLGGAVLPAPAADAAPSATVDIRDLTLPGIPAEARGDVASLVLYDIAGRLAQQFEAVRGHHLDQRRYMFRVQY